jgi:phenylalanyl-tRNA synthetase alpha chain
MDMSLLPAEIADAQREFPSRLQACVDLDALLRLKGAYIGREGSHAAQMMELLKSASKQAELESSKKARDEASQAWDPTLPPPVPARGALNPLNRLMDRLVDVFRPLGYHVEEGPEIETEEHNFDGLNIPADHPARGASDTFYLAAHPHLQLRPHTSPVQVRVLKRLASEIEKKGGIRFLAPGRVYRKDEIDPTHSPMFHQVEGMLVGKGVGMQHLKGTLAYAMKALFGPGADVRFRPSYFPFVEPGCEMDVRCPLCGGQGCRVCKGSGWVELLGAGLIHPNVLRHAGIDPEIWSGFAFGMGVERTAMMVSQTPDLRLFFENDQRFIQSMGGL